MKVDREIDFHGLTRAEMRAWLESAWARREWLGLRRIRVIHGTGAVLSHDVRRWCEEKGIDWAIEPQNPGVTIIHPARVALTPPPPPNHPFASLKPLAEKKHEEARREEAEKRKAAQKATPPPSPQRVSDEELFRREMELLQEADPRLIWRKKNFR